MSPTQSQTTNPTRSLPIKVLTVCSGKEIGVRRLKKDQLIVEPEADGGNDSTSVQLHQDAVGTIYDAAIMGLVRSNPILMKKNQLVSNLVKYNTFNPSDGQ